MGFLDAERVSPSLSTYKEDMDGILSVIIKGFFCALLVLVDAAGGYRGIYQEIGGLFGSMVIMPRG